MSRGKFALALYALGLSFGMMMSPADAKSRSESLREIEEMIDRGDVIPAERALSALAQVNNRSPEELMVRAKLARDGETARSFLRAALASTTAPRRREEVYLALARLAQAEHNPGEMKAVLSDYEREFPRGEMAAEVMRLSVYLAERADDLASARKVNLQLKRSGRRAADREWAQLNIARYNDDTPMLKRLSAARGSDYAPVALYLLIKRSVAKKRFDEAALNLSILREAYSSAVGSDELIDIISGLSTDDTDDGKVEELVGSFYSIQVGVFSVRANAEKQRKRFERYGEPVNVQVKNISGKRYYAVYVGGFTSADRAEAFRTQLERSENELYSIVLRQR